MICQLLLHCMACRLPEQAPNRCRLAALLKPELLYDGVDVGKSKTVAPRNSLILWPMARCFSTTSSIFFCTSRARQSAASLTWDVEKKMELFITFRLHMGFSGFFTHQLNYILTIWIFWTSTSICHPHFHLNGSRHSIQIKFFEFQYRLCTQLKIQCQLCSGHCGLEETAGRFVSTTVYLAMGKGGRPKIEGQQVNCRNYTLNII